MDASIGHVLVCKLDGGFLGVDFMLHLFFWRIKYSALVFLRWPVVSPFHHYVAGQSVSNVTPERERLGKIEMCLLAAF